MLENDKGWSQSSKLQLVAVAALIVVLVYLDNRHNITIADHVISICEVAIVAALGGRIGMGITQSIVGTAEQELGNFNYTPDPKDVDDGTLF